MNNTQAFSGFSPGGSDINATSSGINTPLSAILNPTLVNNGGRTRTHALVPGSPALNAVASGCPPPSTDQRGLPRPQGPRCDIGAVEATFCGGSLVTILGTPGNNMLTGTAGRDVIAGLGGNDTLNGLGGNDVLCGGEGNDTLRGGSGGDLLFGEPGNDWLFAGPGQDRLFGQRGRDQMFGGPDNDELLGGPDDDVLNGEANRDVCDGGGHVQGDTALNCEVMRNVP